MKKIILIIVSIVFAVLLSIHLTNYITAKDKSINAVGKAVVERTYFGENSTRYKSHTFSSLKNIYVIKSWGFFEHHADIYGVIELKKGEHTVNLHFRGTVYIESFTGNTISNVYVFE